MRAEVITPWMSEVVNNGMTGFSSPLWVDYPTIKRITDTTGQPAENITPKPNMYIVQIECSPEVLQEIEDDPLYQVLWSEE